MGKPRIRSPFHWGPDEIAAVLAELYPARPHADLVSLARRIRNELVHGVRGDGNHYWFAPVATDRERRAALLSVAKAWIRENMPVVGKNSSAADQSKARSPESLARSLARWLVPGKDREAFLGDLLEILKDMEREGRSLFRRRLYVVKEVLHGSKLLRYGVVVWGSLIRVISS